MRYLGVLVFFGACSSSPDRSSDVHPIDAVTDVDPCANVAFTGCVFGGLAGLPFDGVTQWTLTGTKAEFAQSMPFTETMQLTRNGCGLKIVALIGSGDLTITDTHASRSNSGETPHPFSDSAQLCLSDADHQLHYTSRSMQTMPAFDETIDGVLSH